MPTISELSRTIHAFVVNKQFTEALDFFKKNKKEFSDAAISKNEFLIADMLTALRGIEAYDAALQFLVIYNIIIDAQTPVRILNSYGWLLYFQYKKSNNTTNLSENSGSFDEVIPQSEKGKNDFQKTDVLETRIEQLMDLLQHTNDIYSTNLSENLFKWIMHSEKNRLNINWHYVERICSLIDPKKMNTTCDIIHVEQQGQQKEMELASVREEWYVMYSKALFEIGNFNRCQELCEQAFSNIDKMHYANEIWFNRRITQCLFKTNNFERAINSYLRLITKKHDWFMLKELSECYFQVGDLENALYYGCQAAYAYGPIHFKVDLIELLGDVLQKQHNNQLAYKHFMLAKMIRENEKWRVDNVLEKKITSNANEIPENKETIKAQLISFWNDKGKKQDKIRNFETGTKMTGTITKLLMPKETGMDGFVKSDNGSTAYFFVPTNVPLFNQLKVGLRIEYDIHPAPKGDKAIKITKL